MVMVWVHLKPYFVSLGELFFTPAHRNTPQWDGTMSATRVSIYVMDMIWPKPDQISKTTIAKNSSLGMEIVSMKYVFLHLRILLLCVRVPDFTFSWSLKFIHFCTFLHTEEWKHSVSRLEDFTNLNSNACLADETHYTDRCELLRWGWDGHMQMSLIWTGAKFLTGAVAALGENASI